MILWASPLRPQTLKNLLFRCLFATIISNELISATTATSKRQMECILRSGEMTACYIDSTPAHCTRLKFIACTLLAKSKKNLFRYPNPTTLSRALFSSLGLFQIYAFSENGTIIAHPDSRLLARKRNDSVCFLLIGGHDAALNEEQALSPATSTPIADGVETLGTGGIAIANQVAVDFVFEKKLNVCLSAWRCECDERQHRKI